jgi:hypothetical protein
MDTILRAHNMSTAIEEDPFGFTHVSGPYGPGVWATYLLAIILSLYSLARLPNKDLTITILPAILYIN